jgi:hypothetical protein
MDQLKTSTGDYFGGLDMRNVRFQSQKIEAERA